MKALCWYGKNDVQISQVPDPTILNPRDAIIKITSTAICGSDLHLYDGFIPTMEKGDILGHEFMGEVVELGSAVKNLQIGDRVVVPFTIACGHCYYCQNDQWALCDNSNPNALMTDEAYGYSASAIYGYSHLYGGYAGGQAEYARVPFADIGPIKVPEGLTDEQVLFLSDIFPTGYQAAQYCGIKPGDTVAVWGAGPVGQFAIQSAYLLGAERVISIDHIPERLTMSRDKSKAEIVNFDEQDNLFETLKEMTGGRGPDHCIDAVGLEAAGHGLGNIYDKTKELARLTSDRSNALRQAIQCCGKGGTVSVPGVYGGLLDKFPFGAAFAKELTFKMGQTHVQRLLKPLMQHIVNGDIDPTFIISHRMKLDDAPEGYKIFKEKKEDCTKVVLTP